MPFDCAHISKLHRKWPCQVPPALTVQFHPLLPLHTPSFHPLFRHCPLTLHSTWIRLNTCPIPIYRSRFEACLPQYVEYSMMVLGDVVSPEQVDLMKVGNYSNSSYLLVILVSTMFLSLVASGLLFESDSILLHTWRKLWQHIPMTGCIHHPHDRSNINIFNVSSHMKVDTKSFHSTSPDRVINQIFPTFPMAYFLTTWIAEVKLKTYVIAKNAT